MVNLWLLLLFATCVLSSYFEEYELTNDITPKNIQKGAIFVTTGSSNDGNNVDGGSEIVSRPEKEHGLYWNEKKEHWFIYASEVYYECMWGLYVPAVGDTLEILKPFPTNPKNKKVVLDEDDILVVDDISSKTGSILVYADNWGQQWISKPNFTKIKKANKLANSEKETAGKKPIDKVYHHKEEEGKIFPEEVESKVTYPKKGSTIRAKKNFKDIDGKNIVKDDEFIVHLIMRDQNYMLVKNKNSINLVKNNDNFRIKSINLVDIEVIQSKVPEKWTARWKQVYEGTNGLMKCGVGQGFKAVWGFVPGMKVMVKPAHAKTFIVGQYLEAVEDFDTTDIFVMSGDVLRVEVVGTDYIETERNEDGQAIRIKNYHYGQVKHTPFIVGQYLEVVDRFNCGDIPVESGDVLRVEAVGTWFIKTNRNGDGEAIRVHKEVFGKVKHTDTPFIVGQYLEVVADFDTTDKRNKDVSVARGDILLVEAVRTEFVGTCRNGDGQAIRIKKHHLLKVKEKISNVDQAINHIYNYVTKAKKAGQKNVSRTEIEDFLKSKGVTANHIQIAYDKWIGMKAKEFIEEEEGVEKKKENIDLKEQKNYE